MPTYQEALKFAVDKKFGKAIGKVNDTITELDKQVGNNTNFHLFLYQRLASMHMLERDLLQVEDVFKKCVDVSENVSKNLKTGAVESVFMW